jgi:aminomethyltransferase
MTDADATLRYSPLHQRHVDMGAKFAPFGGWSMPLEYTGVRREHQAVRTAVGIFDVSHLGTLEIFGPGIVDALNTVFTNDLGKIGPGRAQYSLLCADDGTVIDDVIVYILTEDHMVVVPNAANAAKVAAAVEAAVGPEVRVVNAHEDTAVIAVQGPRSSEVLRDAGISPDLRYMHATTASIADTDIVICRTGYTGERGFELLVPADRAVAVWDHLLTAGERYGITACGLGARDTLRTEMGYPLHGQDLGTDIGPIEAGLTWAVGWNKPEFPGKTQLVARRQSDLAPQLLGIVMIDRGVPRAGMAVHLRPDGPVVGRLTSGTFSPTLHTGIGLALLDRTVSAGDEVSIDVRGRWLTGRVTAPPMVASHVRD